MAITRFVPLRSGLGDVAVLQNRLNSIFNEFARPEGGSETLATGNFIPAVDVYEDAHRLVLKLEVPGIRKEDLDINVEGHTLTVRGERKFQNEEKEENFHRIERSYGSFTRSFTLPNTVDVENVEASTSDGVLTLSLPKKPEAKPKQIQVRVGDGSTGQAKQVEAKGSDSNSSQTRTSEAKA